MKLESIERGQALEGVEVDRIVEAIAIHPVSEDSFQLVYKLPDGSIKETLLDRSREEELAVATKETPWSFDGDGDAFKLTVEAKRIDFAFLFDPMMAVHTSNVEPLPHQITAVYESMLPRQPLRFVLADDPGAGKTIMAGLYIRELIMRADADRVLVVAPGSLVTQWRDELFEKFGLEFRVYSQELEAASPSGNPFEDFPMMIVRLDQMSRNEELQEKLCSDMWDLVVFDEAHKLSAHFYGKELKKTGRFKLAEKVGAATRHLLLMSATPHNGKEEDFQLFLSLLDSDRFYGKFRDGVHKVDASDLMRRMVKEELVKFDGRPLFPERKAYTANYKLSDLEVALYEAVTEYVKTEMGKADELDGKRKGSVGFALTALQRRVASSPEAIYQSLKNRRERLEKRLREEKVGERGRQLNAGTLDDIPEDDDELEASEQEELEEKLVDQATAAQTIEELQAEIEILGQLVEQAKGVVTSGQDRKWDELSSILQDNPHTRDADGQIRKLIVFTEHKATLAYLHQRIGDLIGNMDAIVTIHGGTQRDERIKNQALFRSDKKVRVLIATDAAGEGVNLQNANLMVNYDLPWNPNRMEQRFGRIHRIGQTEVCHLWNLVAKETREGDVYHRLLTKIENISDAFKGRVFDVLGEVFEEKSLKEMLIEAVRYNDRPDVRAQLNEIVDAALDEQHLHELLDRNALSEEHMGADRLFKVKEEMEKAEARRLQPYFVRSFFMKAFETLGGSIYPREKDRWEVTHVPLALRDRDRRITGRNRRDSAPVLKAYERVCFTKDSVRLEAKPNAAMAVMLHPGHPLMLSASDLVLEKHQNLLRQGAILVDPSEDGGEEPWLLVMVTHEVRSGDDTVLSKRLQFIRVAKDGQAGFAGWAPHLDLVPMEEADKSLVASLAQEDWISDSVEKQAIGLASQTLVPEHYKEVADRRIEHVDRTLQAVNDRLNKEISFWSDRYMKLSDDKAASKDVRLNMENVRRTLNDLQARLENRKKNLKAMRHVTSGTPVVVSAALVVPQALLNQLKGEPTAPNTFAQDPDTRKKIESIAMRAVIAAEEANGCQCVDVSAQKCGWDITSYPPAVDGIQPQARHIEVKGRAKEATTITVTRNEILYALNQADKFVLAIVLVDGDDQPDGPHYVTNPFTQEPDYGVASINYNLDDLLGIENPGA
jgi:superfamily II DNA or RNA helicase